MLNPLNEILFDIENSAPALLGFETGVKGLTLDTLDVIREVATNTSGMENVAIIPVGSRLKGYASTESDLDLLLLSTGEGVDLFDLRMRLQNEVFDRTRISVSHSADGHMDPDDMLTLHLNKETINADFSSKINSDSIIVQQFASALLLTPTFIGDSAADYFNEALMRLLGTNEDNLTSTQRYFDQEHILPSKGVDDSMFRKLGERFFELAEYELRHRDTYSDWEEDKDGSTIIKNSHPYYLFLPPHLELGAYISNFEGSTKFEEFVLHSLIKQFRSSYATRLEKFGFKSVLAKLKQLHGQIR